MRTTLDIDDSVLAAAKEVAQSERLSAGFVISQWARKGLASSADQAVHNESGFPIFSVPGGSKPISVASVKALLADEGLPPGR